MAKKVDGYYIDGVKIPSVSEIKGILHKPALVPWAAKMTVEYLRMNVDLSRTYTEQEFEVLLKDAKSAHRVRKEEAGEFGDNVHEIVSTYIDGQLKPEDIKDPDERRSLENFIIATEGWTWHASEVKLINHELRYGGTSDGLASLPSGMVVIPDIKTSGGVWPEFTLQIALYSHPDSIPTDPDNPKREALLRELWPKIEEGRILHFDKERCTWEILERQVIPHYPYIPHFREVYDWTVTLGK